MEVSSVSAAAPLSKEAAVPRSASWRARLRPLLRPANWPAAPEVSPIPRWVHALLWLWLLGLDALKLSTNLATLGHMPATSAEWQPLLPLLGRLALEDMCGALLFYLTWSWLIPRTLGRARVAYYVLLAAILVLPYAALIGWITTQTFRKTPQMVAAANEAKRKAIAAGADPKKANKEMPELWMRIVSSGIVGVFIVGSSSALRVTGDYIRGQRNRREMERQQLLTELAMLKTQINPHFLFNTLNNIYSLTSRKSDKAPEAVLRLAEIMRYLLYESSTDTVPLSRELAHLRSFLDLQRLRLSASAQDAIQFDVSGTSPDCAHPIAPLLLLPLVENAFKHGDLTARPVAVHISLVLSEDGELRFSVLNHVAPADAERELPRQPGGVGLVNLSRRLELLYPGRYTLQVQTPPGQHLVTLVLAQEVVA
ncbi:hypothetical protein GCM10027346_21970 [Hymenobacter seoulensis]